MTRPGPSSPQPQPPSTLPPVTTLHTPGPWHAATFLERPNRFVVHARIDDTGEEVRTHLPDPGRLRELLIPGCRVWLTPATTPRKTAWSCIYVESPDGDLVCCDTRRPNELVGAALRDGTLDELAGWDLVRAEAPWESSRFDFLLGSGQGQMYVEVKGVSWIVDGVARFPDAVTARGAKHLHELAHIADQEGHAAALVFVLQRSKDVAHIEAARDRDPVFADALSAARDAGVHILGRASTVELERTTLGSQVPVSA